MNLLRAAALCCAIALTTPDASASAGAPEAARPTGSAVSAPAGLFESAGQPAAAPQPAAQKRLPRSLEVTGRINGHLARSHSLDLLKRPVSAVASALSLTLHSGMGLIRDTVLDVVVRPYLSQRSIPPLSGSPGMDLEAWEARLDRITGTRNTRGSVSLLVDGEAFFQRLTEEISMAQKSIRFRTYIFDNDDYAIEIANRLKHRSSEVSVKVAIDGLGSLSGALVSAPSMPAAAMTPVSIATYLENRSQVEARTLANTWFMGDHTKTYIFDGRTGFLGGMNIGREYRYDWHDMMVELSGPIVSELVRESDKAEARDRLGDLWFLASLTGASAQPQGRTTQGARLRLLRTTPYESQIYRSQLAAIRGAKRRIYIENAYFSDDRILYALIGARLRGVDVRVILPSRGDSGPMDRSNSVTTNILTRFGVRVFLYPGMSHMKVALFDGWACFGSANFDRLSLRLNRELNIGTSDPELVAKLEAAIFQADFARSVEVHGPRPSHFSDQIYERLADLIL